MPKTRMAYDRIKRMHDEGNHERCQFGCCPENQAPSVAQEFAQGQLEASQRLAEQLGPDDSRVAVARDTRAFLRTSQALPEMLLISLGCCAAFDEDLSGSEPDQLDLIKVRRCRRMLDGAISLSLSFKLAGQFSA